MTLIITTLGPTGVTLTSDMRLSSPGSVTELSGKAGLLKCHDGIAVYAYTGLARMGDLFRAKTWIADAFMESSSTEIRETIYQFADIARKKFSNLSYRGHDFTLALAGYSYDGKPFIGSVSNTEGDDGVPLAIVSDRFAVRVQEAQSAGATCVLVSGINRHLYETELRWIMDAISAGENCTAILARAGATIRRLSDDSRTHNMVGKDLLCASIIPMALTGEPRVQSEFRPMNTTETSFCLDQVDLTGRFAIRDIELTVSDTVFIEKIGRNSRCSCGSGLKHKRCCGR